EEAPAAQALLDLRPEDEQAEQVEGEVQEVVVEKEVRNERPRARERLQGGEAERREKARAQHRLLEHEDEQVGSEPPPHPGRHAENPLRVHPFIIPATAPRGSGRGGRCARTAPETRSRRPGRPARTGW